ncbi:hypothetical protein [Paenibacillus xylanexedens]|uniref:hypothetical protein n=1 Tax=Paenibacillus xylanexedens TaxID=528191 RepID=UPI000F52158E|nr:hypothetical protein [Paenibacillus xylanexedens]
MNWEEEIRKRATERMIYDANSPGWSDTSELTNDVFFLLGETERLRKELDEARKIKFPRHADSEGGWVLDYKFLERLGVTMLRESDHTINMEDIELVLLTLEVSLGHEGVDKYEQ